MLYHSTHGCGSGSLSRSRHFIKFDRRVHQLTGCTRATLIFSALEYWFSKKPEGFYKFIEPCSHKLYKPGDSWTEELGCDRKTFAQSFKKIGVRYSSRTAYEQATDKFQGKLYASYYDRYTNQTFFIRNAELVTQFLGKVNPHQPSLLSQQSGCSSLIKPSLPSNEVPQLSPISSSVLPFSTGNSPSSYIETKNTSIELSNDNSHAGKEVIEQNIIQQMLEVWVSLVGVGKKKLELTAKRIAFLKKALVDKFHNSLEEWTAYCKSIVSSKFLMGEIKASFRATLDWALKFEVIQRVLEGAYGIGDRNPPSIASACEAFIKNSKMEMVLEEEEIRNKSDEPELVRAFRLKWLNKFGANNYRELLADCVIEMGDNHTLILHPTTRYKAKWLAGYNLGCLLSQSISKVHIIQREGDLSFEHWYLKDDSLAKSSHSHDKTKLPEISSYVGGLQTQPYFPLASLPHGGCNDLVV